MSERLPNYGGQAVIEGVLMRGTRHVAMAMRAPDGRIELHSESLGGIYSSQWMKIPFIRGLVGLWDALVLGTRLLTISANMQVSTEERLAGASLYGTVAVSLAIGVGLFFLLPAGLGQLLETQFGWTAISGNLAEGIFRLFLLIIYLWLIGFMPDIRRVFQYHGAEHKVINGFEAKSDLTVDSIQNQSMQHPRCGTSFLLTLVVLSIIVFAALGPLSIAIRFISRIVFLPVIAAIAYEYIRWMAVNINKPAARWLIKPNLWLQKLTTRQPDLKQIEVALVAFTKMLEMEQEDKKQSIG
jgi:uncharacterized protein YqhQ